jgi:hypothetical protein
VWFSRARSGFRGGHANWFGELAKGRAGVTGQVQGHPIWRPARTHEGLVVRDLVVARQGRKWATIQIPKLGGVRFRLTRPWARVLKATSATVSMDRAGNWHVARTCPPTFVRVSTRVPTGVDRGVKNRMTHLPKR